MSFVKLLAVRGGAGEFSACVKRFRENEYRDHGIAVAQAVTARPLTDEQRAALTEKLRALTGKTILLDADGRVAAGWRASERRGPHV